MRRPEDTIKNYFAEETDTDNSGTFLSPEETHNESDGELNTSMSNQPLASSSRRSLGRGSTKSKYKARPRSKQKVTTLPSRQQEAKQSYRSQQENESSNRRSLRSQNVSNIASQQATQSQISTSRRKKKKPKKHVLQEIRQYQASTKNLIPKLPFSKLIREVMTEYSDSGMRITPLALEAIQESAEIYLTIFFEDAYRCTLHRGRVTLIVKDMELVRVLRGVNDPGYRNPTN